MAYGRLALVPQFVGQRHAPSQLAEAGDCIRRGGCDEALGAHIREPVEDKTVERGMVELQREVASLTHAGQVIPRATLLSTAGTRAHQRGSFDEGRDRGGVPLRARFYQCRNHRLHEKVERQRVRNEAHNRLCT